MWRPSGDQVGEKVERGINVNRDGLLCPGPLANVVPRVGWTLCTATCWLSGESAGFSCGPRVPIAPRGCHGDRPTPIESQAIRDWRCTRSLQWRSKRRFAGRRPESHVIGDGHGIAREAPCRGVERLREERPLRARRTRSR